MYFTYMLNSSNSGRYNHYIMNRYNKNFKERRNSCNKYNCMKNKYASRKK